MSSKHLDLLLLLDPSRIGTAGRGDEMVERINVSAFDPRVTVWRW